MQTPAQIVRLVDSALTLGDALPAGTTSNGAEIPADCIGQLFEAVADYASMTGGLSSCQSARATAERPDGIDPASLFGGEVAVHATPEVLSALDAAVEERERQVRRAAGRIAACYEGVALPFRDEDIPGTSTVTPAMVVEAGLLLYGPTWQTAMARDLSVDARTVRRWAEAARNDSEVRISSGIRDDLAALIAARRDALDALPTRLGGGAG